VRKELTLEKAVLAFSGGLDTSFCVLYLKEHGYEVVTVTVDTGGFSDQEIAEIEARAKELGASKHYTIDGKPPLYDKLVKYILTGNILRGGVYPLSAGPERLIQATEVVKIAQLEQASTVAHGSTGAGNDQIRFDVAIRVLAPELKIVTPIREHGLSRAEEIAFLQDHGYSVSKVTSDYSINKGMLGTTIGGKETKDPWQCPPEDVYPQVVPLDETPNVPETIIIGFKQGLPVSLNDQELLPQAMMRELESIGARHGVGKNIHLGDTIVGIKGRIAFEAPAPIILIRAHRELEKLVLTKWQAFWKDHLATVYGNFLHEGLYFDPVMRDIEALIDSSQSRVTGAARVKLYKGNIVVEGCQSPYSLMDSQIATYGEENVLWDGRDALGFSKIYGLASMLAMRAGR
jgi:argininosuccinate synthase